MTFKTDSPRARGRSFHFALSALFLVALPAAADVRYTITAKLDLESSRIEGNVQIVLSGADMPREDVVFLSTRFDDSRRLELTGAFRGQDEVPMDAAGGRAALMLPRAPQGAGELSLSVDFRLVDLPEFEGVVLLDDNIRAGERICWYPRALEVGSETASYDIILKLRGGAQAISAEDVTVSGRGGERDYFITAGASLGVVVAASPIFREQRVLTEGCNLGIFSRRGSEDWDRHLVSAFSEVYGYCALRIPGFARKRMDVVLAGRGYDDGAYIPRLAFIRDELDDMAERFGGVFAANYLRWLASIQITRSYVGSKELQEESAIPWLREGLSLLLAEDYGQFALLGGPAFANIRQFYINAAAAGLDTTLDRGRADVESSGLDWMQVLARSKGLWVVGMLRDALGKEAWNELLRRILAEPGDPRFTADALQSLAEAVSGKPLGPFFDQWVRGDARLDYGIVEVESSRGGNRVLLSTAGDAAPEMILSAVFQDGRRHEEKFAIEKREKWLGIEESGALRRVEIDPERILPDLNRGNNIRSFGSAERIEMLFKVDEVFDVGEVLFGAVGETRETPFEVTVTNLTEEQRALGLRLTARFPGGRNRGLTRVYLELAPGETTTIRDTLALPEDGSGPAEARADYYMVRSRAEFENLDNGSEPALTNYYVLPAESR